MAAQPDPPLLEAILQSRKLINPQLQMTYGTMDKPNINAQNLLKKGNDSLAIGAMWGVGAIAHPCPLCVLTAGAFLVNGVREKLKK
ncbi:hypothetical protein HY988_00565 [Candidatus Micrarchaeota archaeon]|nr:hypothetical protein [Candidatus Micrarchaeota archaeon]